MATDGSIVIDTRVNTSGMDAGVKSIASSFGGVTNAVKKTTKALSTAFLGGSNVFAIIKSIAKFTAAAFIGGSLINSVRNLAESFDLMSSSVGDKIKPLNEAFETLKGTLVNLMVTAFIPMIPSLIDIAELFTKWLTTIILTVSALLGFKQTVGSIMTKAASDAKKAAKEAKGALAAFDQINILQKQEAPEGITGPLATPAAMTIPQGLLDQVQKIKDIIASWFADPIGKLKETWGKIVEWFKVNVLAPITKWWNETWFGKLIGGLWTNFIDTWQKIIANTSETFATIKKNIALFLQGINDFLTGVFTGNWSLAWEGLKKIVAAIFGNLWAIITGVWANILIFLVGWKNAAIIILKFWANTIQTNVLDPIRAAFGTALDWVKNKFVSSFSTIRDFVMGIINTILAGIAMVTGASGGIGPGSLGGRPGSPGSLSGRLPRLATGAVIPPNAQFAAILGDQRSGRNIEAPESLIRQIVREESGQGQNIRISFEGSLAELVRVLKPKIDQENRRVGGSLLR